MTTHAISKRTAYLATGGIGLLLAAGYLAMTTQLPFGALDEPGAGLFPTMVGAILVFASLATVWEGWKAHNVERIDMPAGGDRNRMLLLIALLSGYFLSMPWVGYTVSSAIFATLLIRLLSSVSWLRCAAYGVVMTALVYLLFIYLLKVPMPVGEFSFAK